MKNILLSAIGLCLLLACKDGSNRSGGISGAGATFPLPYYNVVFKNYTQATGTKVTYGGIGSGGGIRSLKDQTVDFGASDAYLSDKELQAMNGEVLHVPTCMGAVVLAYNLPEVAQLNLTGNLVSNIFRGKITRWNDARIQAVNPGVNLPNEAITPVFRSDGSGTTYVFSDYLSKVDPEWAGEMGTEKALKWPMGIASKGNPGVSNTVKQTKGAIGYVGSEYALSLGIATALLQNQAGNFMEATTQTISAAANMELPADMRTMVTNSPDPDAYPISCFTWIIVYKNQRYANRSQAQSDALVNLLNYILDADAQALADKIHYAPLPATALQKAKDIVKQISF